MMALKAGVLFAGRYEVVRVLSAGGMGIVYEVIDRGTKRHRALKVMLPHVLTDEDMRERFALEAIVTAEIESEHLVEVFDAGIEAESDCPYLIMELLRGEDLGARLRRGARMGRDEVVLLLEQAALALEKTHAHGIVHRDLKPENLFVTKRDDGSTRLKILDFGIAKIVKSTAPDPKSTTKTFGTPYYMAREQVTGEALLIGPSSDTYALGQIAFALLVGSPYFEDEAAKGQGNMLSLLLAVGAGAEEPASLRARRRGVELPPEFDAWFARATSITPSKRFAFARDMVTELAVALGVTPSAPLRHRSSPEVVAAVTNHATSSTPSGPAAIGGTIPIASDAPARLEARPAAPPSAPPPSAQASGTPSGSAAASQTGAQSFSTTQAKRLDARPRRRWVPVLGGAVALGVGVAVVTIVTTGPGPAGITATTDPASAAPTAELHPDPSAPPARVEVSGAVESAQPAASSSAAPSASGSSEPAPKVERSGRPAPPPRVPSTGAGERPVWQTR